MSLCRACKTRPAEKFYVRCRKCRREFNRLHPELKPKRSAKRRPGLVPQLPPKDWFMDRIAFEPNTGCWLWAEGVMDQKGYGMVYKGYRPGRKAHRVSYEMFVGPIPEGIHVCHRCDTPTCVNPLHLFLGTHTDNHRDCVRKGRSGNAKLTLDDVRLLREMAASGVRTVELMVRFGIGRTAVRHIINRETWRDVA